ncbi:MAG: endonuclease [Bacteroidetes bacterium]|jgi:endonuclease/exonuclease/phosphatase (EEP) superfamily protein YafD|nr:endonuclease [Bacteroidota bacterium]
MTIASGFFAVFMLLSALLPLVRSDYWTFRALEYPRLQKWVLLLIALIVWSSVAVVGAWLYWSVNAALIATVLYLSYLIFPYLPIAPREMQAVAAADKGDTSQQLSLLIANVYQYNRHAQSLIDRIERLKPDLVFLLETDEWWREQLGQVRHRYPHHIEMPQENTYGLLFYSQLPLESPEVRRLIEPEIPSIKCWVKLKSGQKVQLFGLHPKPPAPSESIRTTEKDQELLLIAEEAADCDAPVIVAGDLNDVAWSYTTELFQKMSRLLDPRKGRGFFNTFPVKYPLMRFPLDHVFCSNHFRLVKLTRLGSIGSDHFPVFIQLHCAQRHKEAQPTPTPDEQDKHLAAEKKNNKV